MFRSRLTVRAIASMAIVAQIGLFTLPAANAALVGADATLTPGSVQTLSADESRQRLNEALARDEVREQLVRNGVTADMAAMRVAALSDREAIELARQFDELPAGASFSGLLIILFFGWALMEITDWGQIFAGDEKPAATQ